MAAHEALVVGLGSALGFAVANALQHRAAGTVPPTVHHALAVLAHLARQRIWLAATGISLTALLLHATALHLGSIALVQPLMLVGVVLAVPTRSLLVGEAPRWPELQGVCVTVLGLLAFILSAQPNQTERPAGVFPTAVFVVGCTLLGLATLRLSGSGLVTTLSRRAAALGVGAGLMFGASAGLLKVLGTVLAAAQPSPSAAVAVVIALLVTGLLGTAMNQKAYQLAPLSCSMPLLNVTDIVVAVLFSGFVLGQPPGHSPVLVGLQLTALICVGFGLRRIAALPSGGSAAGSASAAAGVRASVPAASAAVSPAGATA
jgi:drug/metabolite transporter (DMT)-like permease